MHFWQEYTSKSFNTIAYNNSDYCRPSIHSRQRERERETVGNHQYYTWCVTVTLNWLPVPESINYTVTMFPWLESGQSVCCYFNFPFAVHLSYTRLSTPQTYRLKLYLHMYVCLQVGTTSDYRQLQNGWRTSCNSLTAEINTVESLLPWHYYYVTNSADILLLESIILKQCNLMLPWARG